MKSYISLVAALMLAVACSPNSPDDGAQYFSNIAPETSALDAEKQRLEAAETTVVAQEDGVEDIAASALASLDTPEANLVAGQNSASISDSQDFSAVSARETIESDAAKLAALRERYQEVSTEDVGTVPTRNGPNLASYALQAQNAVGEKVYGRFNIGLSGCGRFRVDPDAAQREFLANGGPERDPRRLDPDGDGFACDWDPSIYRRLLAPAQG